MNDIEDISRKCILTEGVAGAGKTTAAIDKVNQYLSDHPEKKDKVILLTLTNTGAKEIGIRTNHRITKNICLTQSGHTVQTMIPKWYAGVSQISVCLAEAKPSIQKKSGKPITII